MNTNIARIPGKALFVTAALGLGLAFGGGQHAKSASADQFFKPDLKVTFAQHVDLGGTHITYFNVKNNGISTATNVTATGLTGEGKRITAWTPVTFKAQWGMGSSATNTLSLGSIQPGETKLASIVCFDTHDSICMGAQLTATTPGELDPSDNTASHGQPF